MARLCFLTERMVRGWGVDHGIHRVAEGLAQRGHEVDVVCLRADRSYGDTTYRVRLLDVPAEPLDTLEARIAARAGLLRQRVYDLYVAAMFPFFGVASRLGLPFVYYEHGVVDPAGQKPHVARVLARIRRDARRHQRRARRIAAISRFLVGEQVHPAKRAVTDVVYLGADSYGPPPPPAAVQALRARLGLADAEVVGYVGRVEQGTYKGVDDLIEILGALRAVRPRARLLLVGRSEHGGAAHFGALPGVTVCADVPAADMPACYAAMDVVVSASRWEGFNLPLAEAQRYARPVVAYRVGAHPEVVAPSGALVASRPEFVAAVAGLLADPGARRRRGEEARVFAERFTWAATVDALAACFAAAGVPALS
jgi:1,2-diacylglycerol 3-alpha-glucosyltransferase